MTDRKIDSQFMTDQKNMDAFDEVVMNEDDYTSHRVANLLSEWRMLHTLGTDHQVLLHRLIVREINHHKTMIKQATANAVSEGNT